MKVRIIKRLDRYVISNFIPLLMVTLPVCWFVVLMQFLYRYIDELVGKGLSLWIVAQVIFYAAMTFLPLALPLGVLLASLMTFGNLGERLELLAMKASGISLFRIMRPLFVLVVAISVGLFVFENDFMIKSQVRLWTLIYSARSTAPELEIPERSFYNAINGYNIYVHHRDRQSGMLHDIILYDYSRGINNARIIRADSGRLLMNNEKNFLKWKLFNGQSFENLQQNVTNYSSQPISHLKERFSYKEVVIPFDAQFKKQDESAMKSLFVGKNLNELTQAIAESRRQIDSVRLDNVSSLQYVWESNKYSINMPHNIDTTAKSIAYRHDIFQRNTVIPISLDSLITIPTLVDSLSIVNIAVNNMQRMYSEITSRQYNDNSYFYTYRTNVQERHRKFTFPIACLVFFLIGAPLGAIIRKGGIGMPMIACIMLFLLYYVIDTMGYKLSNSQTIPFWFGSWISILVLLPLGIFLTIVSARDSTSLNTDAWAIFFRRLLGLHRTRRIEMKEIVISAPSTEDLMTSCDELMRQITALQKSPLMTDSFLTLWLHGHAQCHSKAISEALEDWLSKAENYQHILFVSKLKDCPYMPREAIRLIPANKKLSITLAIVLPLSVPITLYEYRRRKMMKRELNKVLQVLTECKEILSVECNNKK